MAAIHPSERPARRAVHGTCPPPDAAAGQVTRFASAVHGTCPPLAAGTGHKPTVPFRSAQEWASPPPGAAAGLRKRLESLPLG
jgi:hypothetical protein